VNGQGIFEGLLGEELPMPLVFADHCALKSDIREEGCWLASDKHLNRLFQSSNSLTFPDVPSLFQDLIDVMLFELNGDEEASRIVKHRIGTHEKAELGVDSHQKSGVETEGVLPELVKLTILRSVFELEPMLVCGPVAGCSGVGEKCVGHDPQTFPLGCFESDAKWSSRWRRAIKDSAAFAAKGLEHEVEEGLAVFTPDVIRSVFGRSVRL
jgi:hypothetical protein